MDKLTMDNVVGFVLAVLFAFVIGISMWALLVGDYVNTVMNEQTRHTLRIVGFAGALAALVTWWVQSFAAKRGFVIRFLFAFFIFVVAFCSFGGLLRFIYIHATYPSQQDWSLTGMYLASLNDFYTFVLDHAVAAAPGLRRSDRGRRDLRRPVRASPGQGRHLIADQGQRRQALCLRLTPLAASSLPAERLLRNA